MSKNNRVLVTGATGFIGRHLVSALIDAHAAVTVLVRSARRTEVDRLWSGASVTAVVGDLLDPSSLDGVCRDVVTVFHLAGYAHAEDADQAGAEEAHRRLTVEGTRALLRQAALAGVRRFVFASTVKVIGEGGGRCLDETSPLAPVSGYGRAKRAAEELVLEVGDKHGMQVCVLRLPMVYGRDHKGNLARMIAAIDGGWFPPLPQLENRRSMLHVDDAVRALLLAADRPQADGRTYIVTDAEAHSTREVYDRIRTALGKRPPMWRVPLWALRLGARLGDIFSGLRRRPLPFNSSVLEKITGSAWYSGEKIRRELGFQTTRRFAEALPEMVRDYRLRSS